MANINKEILLKEISRLQRSYDEYLREYLLRSEVFKVINEQPVIEMQKCCSTCTAWDRETSRDNKCFCKYLEANTPSDFCCTFWEEDN